MVVHWIRWGSQLTGVVGVAVWVGVTSFVMFWALNALNILHVDPEADRIGIDAFEHHASVWPNVLATAGRWG